ncbi:PepSY-like domain-containing protein [uncultured Roseivirga sp.]|uniref:PepSY-like domain-containing protein n=1 Tax=uncultured Roseivirga sp. TaxID=543088 RepID=UPI0030DA8988|tara:strand:- start:776 stop:1249 length:474 start_codon:yes stop_codon:yes gene_type:complete
MKVKQTMIVLALLLTNLACAQVEAPKAVQDAFKAKFTNAKSVEWEMEEEGEYEANFKMNKVEMSANFKSDGTWLETETEIKEKNLPEAVIATLKAKYDGYKVEETTKIEKPNGVVQYEAEIEKGEETLEVIFNANGTVISSKVVNEDDEEGEEGDEG